MRKIVALSITMLMLTVAIVPLINSLQVNTPSPDLIYGNTVTIDTDASGSGVLNLYRPATNGNCLQITAGSPHPVGGAGDIPNVYLDSAGWWQVEHDPQDGNPLDAEYFNVAPAPLRILASQLNTNQAGVYDYLLQVVTPSGATVPNAYVDVYFQENAVNQFVRHYRADDNGRTVVSHLALPFAGQYNLIAYKDLDVNGQGEITEYTSAYIPQPTPTCDPGNPVDAPERFGTGPEITAQFTGMFQPTKPLLMSTTSGEIQTRKIFDSAEVTLRDAGGQPVNPTTLQFLENGIARPLADMGLSLTNTASGFILEGTWDVVSDLEVQASTDLNGDGVPEYQGSHIITVQPASPIRIECRGSACDPNDSNNFDFSIPERKTNGQAGQHELRFVLLDEDDNELGPNDIHPSRDIGFEGDVLGSSDISYDLQAQEWVAMFTPKNSGSQYDLVVDWRSENARLKMTIETDQEAGARSHHCEAPPFTNNPSPGYIHTCQENLDKQQYTADPLRYQQVQTVTVYVERWVDNNGNGPNFYDYVSDAEVRLFWADTGEQVLDSDGDPYHYLPGAPVGCACSYDGQGRYSFIGVEPERTGTMVAYIVVSENGNPALNRYSYAEIPVLPAEVINPEFTPSVALAGEYTSFQLSGGPGFNANTWQNYDVVITDSEGNDVTQDGQFTTLAGTVRWAAALPEDFYFLHVEERLDMNSNPPLNGTQTTATPGILTVGPAEVTFAYDNSIQLAPNNAFGVNLKQANEETFVTGGGFGKAVRMTMEITKPNGQPASGWVTLHGHDLIDGTSGLFSLADPAAPHQFSPPDLFPPGQPVLTNEDTLVYYIVEEGDDREFNHTFTFRYTGQPIDILAWGTGIGTADVTFKSASSNLNTEEAGNGWVHFVPPMVSIESIVVDGEGDVVGTQQDANKALALSRYNTVKLHVEDATGLVDNRDELDGIEVGLTRDLFGPSQRPSGDVNFPPSNQYGTITVGTTPDATGYLIPAAEKGPSLVQMLFMDELGELTYRGIPVVVNSQIDYDRTNSEIVLDYPITPVKVGEEFRVSVYLSNGVSTHNSEILFAKDATDPAAVDPFFNTIHYMNGGFIRLVAPDAPGDHPFNVTVPGGYGQAQGVISIVNTTAELPKLQIDTLPTSVKEGDTLTIIVSDDRNGIPVQGADVTFGKRTGSTDSNGAVTFKAEAVVADTPNMMVSASKAGYRAADNVPLTITNDDTLKPTTVITIDGQTDLSNLKLQGGEEVTVTLALQDEVGDAMDVTAADLISPYYVSIETTKVPMQLNNDGTASGKYTAPELTQDMQVFLKVKLPDQDKYRQLVTIEGVDA